MCGGRERDLREGAHTYCTLNEHRALKIIWIICLWQSCPQFFGTSCILRPFVLLKIKRAFFSTFIVHCSQGTAIYYRVRIAVPRICAIAVSFHEEFEGGTLVKNSNLMSLNLNFTWCNFSIICRGCFNQNFRPTYIYTFIEFNGCKSWIVFSILKNIADAFKFSFSRDSWVKMHLNILHNCPESNC